MTSGTSLTRPATLVKQYRATRHYCNRCFSLGFKLDIKLRQKCCKPVTFTYLWHKPDLYFQDNKAFIDKDDPAEPRDAAWASSTIQKNKNKQETERERTNLSKRNLFVLFFCNVNNEETFKLEAF